MKKILLILPLLLLLTACNKMVSDIYTVENKSGFLVEMLDIEGANKTTLTIERGKSEQLVFDHQRNKDFKIEFQYGPANLVKTNIDSKEKKLVFTNK